ncbi:hypothetical protein L6164_003096 [Bauhinia variegata]|uniref:Uncharacterized protein n=1 Tax=Bauhinia variegata TaxID=167791 RepID=A0ACB9Q090_BAUVA|nr:hypothetical protein L6164_003096 [Bauhinia variegata]
MTMEFIQRRVEPWIRDQHAKLMKVSWGPLQWRRKWPWSNHREQKKKIQEEYERRRKQLQDLCLALKAESISDLQDILCCMVLSECVYKRPATEMIRAVNKFKADFGGQVVSLERVQPSADHVPHRYLLAEAGDTLFASFIGTKQYRDVVADANILQGAIFHEDAVEEHDGSAAIEPAQGENGNRKGENLWNPLESRPKQLKSKSKPAAHRGFLARAKGIPALELYRLAQKKKRKLVLCGHSLGGAVAALATLAILRVIAASSPSKENEKVAIKCITFSQPPVGNAALKDYVNRKGWQHYFKSFCIPEDLVPRILSPAYFHHYNAQPQVMSSENETTSLSLTKHEQGAGKPKENEGEQLVLGVGPVQRSFWRLSRLVPLEGLRRQFSRLRERQVGSVETNSVPDSIVTALIEEEVVEPQSLEIQEGSDGISLKPLPDTDKLALEEKTNRKTDTKSNGITGDNNWRRVPYLPSYVPFGQLYLLGNSSVESLSGAEYSKLTSVRSVIAELRERFQSHSMRSYRSRFQRIYDLCMSDNASSFLGVEQWQQFPHLQQWLGLAAAGTVELGHIVESPVIRTATSIVPLGWTGKPGSKNGEPLKVDITGVGLHLCTLIHAQVNGNWCSTTVESFPSAPNYSSNGSQPELQKMRVLVGSPLRRPPMHQIVPDSLMPSFASIDTETVCRVGHNSGPIDKEKFIRPESLNNFSIFCTSDFATVSKQVHVRTRRVRLVGLEGSGKTTLLKAILNKGIPNTAAGNEDLVSEVDVHEGIVDGLCYCDSAGVNMQDLNMETSRFRDELWLGIRDLSHKTDLIVFVHNLSHNIPRYSNSNMSEQKPVLSLFLDEAKSLGIPWVLAITNKFSVSAHHQKASIDAVLKAYLASPSTTAVINSSPYVMPSVTRLSWDATTEDSDRRTNAQKLIFAPIDFVKRPFQKKDIVLPVEGVNSLCQRIHCILKSQEEASFQELARDRLMMELARAHAMSIDAQRDAQAKAASLGSAAVGASVGAGLGIVLAIVMGAASALRKP